MRSCLFLLLFSSAIASYPAQPCDSSKTICLTDGDRGAILVYSPRRRIFLPVCHDRWDRADAEVACKEAGFRGALMATTGLDSHGLDFEMDEVSCNGDEERLIDCDHHERHDCGGSEGAGVICDSSTDTDLLDEKILTLACFAPKVSFSLINQIGDPLLMSTSVQCQRRCKQNPDCLHFSFNNLLKKCYLYSSSSKESNPYEVGGPRNCASVPPEVYEPQCNGTCLIGGESESEGNVYMGGIPVCDDGWGEAEANAVCRELNFTGGAQRYTTSSKFGLVPATQAKQKYICTGGEDSLSECEILTGLNCDSSEGAGVTCDTRQPDVIDKEKTCFVFGILYNDTVALQDRSQTDMPAECQTLCQANVNCTHFSWMFSGKKCKLFKFQDLLGKQSCHQCCLSNVINFPITKYCTSILHDML